MNDATLPIAPLLSRRARKRAERAEAAAKLELPLELRQKLNTSLVENGHHGKTCAVLRAPGQRPRIIAVDLPRGSAGHSPRRPVQIPLDSFTAVRREPIQKNARRKPSSNPVEPEVRALVSALKQSATKAAGAFTGKVAAKARGIASLLGRLFAVGNVEATA